MPSPIELMLCRQMVPSTSLHLPSCSLVLRSAILVAALSMQFSSSVTSPLMFSISFVAVMDILASEKIELFVVEVLRVS